MKRVAEQTSPSVKRAHPMKIPTDTIFGFFSQAGSWANTNTPGNRVILDIKLGVKVHSLTIEFVNSKDI